MAGLRTVGILGGMGPEATLALQERVLAAVDARDDSDHVPLIVDMNTQVPSRIAALLEGGDIDPEPVLVAMARRLEMAGARALAMPCNTTHHYAAAISGAVQIPLLNMVTLAANAACAAAGSGGKVGLLCSPAVQQVGIYETAIREQGCAPVYAKDQDALLAAIREVKAGRITGQVRRTLREASFDLLMQDAQVQLVACTEFSLLENALDTEARAMDALDILVQAIVAFSNGAEG